MLRVTLLLCLVLAACTREPELLRELDTYNTRLARALDVDAPATGVFLPEPVPRKKITIEPGKISLLDFLRLFGCELQVTLGERNSQMGKLATDSQRLINALQFIHYAPACIETLQAREQTELAAKLSAALATRREELPAFIFNATLAGPEFVELWRYDLPGDYPDNTSLAVISSMEQLLGYVDAWLDGDVTAGWDTLESTLSQLRAADAGTLFFALGSTHARLEQATAMIESRLAQQPLCFNGQPNRQSAIFETVVLKFFIAGSQPRQARLSQRFHSLLPGINTLEGRLEAVLPESYIRWKLARDQQFALFLSANAAHVQAIKALSSACGLGLGAAG